MDIETVEEMEFVSSSESQAEVDIQSTGPQGLSAYEIYKKNGGVLSEIEWLDSLKGPQGEKGSDGYTPIKGTDYWTNDDINIIKNYCDNKINQAIGGALSGSY